MAQSSRPLKTRFITDHALDFLEQAPSDRPFFLNVGYIATHSPYANQEPELTALYDVADLFLCASEHEGFCVPLVEAFHKRVPVIAYAATAVPATSDRATPAVRAATAGLRRHQRPMRSSRPTGRARIGTPSSQRCRSAVRSPAEP